jgi:hypothetical protein
LIAHALTGRILLGKLLSHYPRIEIGGQPPLGECAVGESRFLVIGSLFEHGFDRGQTRLAQTKSERL